jgi:hypothetical protein
VLTDNIITLNQQTLQYQIEGIPPPPGRKIFHYVSAIGTDVRRGACPRSVQDVNFTEAKWLNKAIIIYICSHFESEKRI